MSVRPRLSPARLVLVSAIALGPLLVAVGPVESAPSVQQEVGPGDFPDPVGGTPLAVVDREGLIDSGLRGYVVDRPGTEVVRVEVLSDKTIPLQALTDAVVSVGGLPVTSYPGLMLTDVRVDALLDLEATDAVRMLRLPLSLSRAVKDDDVSGPVVRRGGTGSRGDDALAKIGIEAWHERGYVGADVAVGIIDSFDGVAWQQAAAAGELPASPASTFCRADGEPCDISIGDKHGVGVAEILLDVAPGARLHLATVETGTDYREAIDHFHAQGVRVISRSMYGPYDGAGDGTGEIADLVAYAEASGMIWVNAAGNSASSPDRPIGSYYRQSWADANDDGWLDITPETSYLPVFCSENQGLFLSGVRWSDWAEARAADASDYDIFLFDEQGGEPYASFTSRQTDGALPVEAAGFERDDCPAGGDWDYLAVKVADPGAGVAGDTFEVLVAATGLGYHSNPGSTAMPAADIVSEGSLSVGAVDPAAGTQIASYSSQGPSNDGRVEPDLSAPSNISNFTYTFMRGTSAATPHVSGMAAVLLGANPSLTPEQVGSFLRTQVVDRGEPGPDSIYGAGEISLGPPPPRVGTSASTSRPGKVRRLRVRPARGDRLRVTWRAPRIGQVVAYRVVVKRRGGKAVRRSIAGRRTSVRIGATGPGVYRVVVRAKAEAGFGQRSVRRVRVRG